MSTDSLVSVIIPTYRRVDYLEEAVASVCRQTYPHVEILVTDDGSGEEYTNQYHLPPAVRFFCHQQQQGPAAARNTALKQAQGDFIAFLDSDDLWLPEKLEAQVRLLRAHPEAGLAHCNLRFVDDNAQPLAPQPRYRLVAGQIFRDLYRYNSIKSPTGVMVRREILDEVGSFDVELNGAEDWDLWLRITRRYPVVADPTVRACYRLHGQQITAARVKGRQAAIKVRTKWLAWAEREAPELVDLSRRYFGMTLQKLATAQAAETGDIRGSFQSLRKAMAYNPWDWRIYTRMIQNPLLALLAKGKGRGTAQA
ncbi:MAG TPA: glycosyltransferase [Armatimonadota bacterium]|jgi:glycosyltransferase involved in cell wall biosynthesis